MQTETQPNASKNAAEDSQPLAFTKEAQNSKVATPPNYSPQAEMRRKWSVETAARGLVHARKF
jgi:hypothetical protein